MKVSTPEVTKPELRQNLKVAALIAASILTAYLCYRVLLPFLPALIWAVTLAIVARPLHRWLDKRLKRRSLTTSLTLLITILVLVIPVVLITNELIDQATSLVQYVRSPEFLQRINAEIAKHPQVQPIINWAQHRFSITEQAQHVAGRAGATVPAAFMGSLSGLTQLAIALFTMFFLLRDFEYFTGALRAFVPLPDKDTNEVLSRIRKTIDASIRGRVFIAIIQGALGGIMFWLLGLPGAVLWGTVMAAFALVPMLGAFIVWMPAAIVLLLAGHPGKALILVIWGALVIGTADNVLYPILVGKDLRLHTITIFFSVLGGVAAFGASGLVLGPVIFAIADALLEVWSRRGPSQLPQEKMAA
jgi:predicted PurR-regulated permease PerM